MELKGSKTEANLKAAFSGESEARNKYSYFASAAKKEGYEQVSAIFLETADNEKEHAKKLFIFLNGIGCTTDNLKAAAAGEHHEWYSMYKDFEAAARDEGFIEIADFFKSVATVEREHEKRYLALLEKLNQGTAFKKEQEIEWKCRNCGHIHYGKEAPESCPTCAHPQAYFEVRCENY